MLEIQFCLAVNVAYFVILVIPSGHVFGDNYPSEINYKPCARLKNTVNYQKPICMDNGSGGFEAESEKNCQESFKATCPEFNRASCEWITNFSFPNSSVTNSSIPCCRLKYKSRHYTWMEIYYTLQYGKDVPVYDIVEIRRKIQNHDAFGQRDQYDWPDSVTDPKGERGLAWVVATNLTRPPNVTGSAADFCSAVDDPGCTKEILQYFSTTYPSGFNDSRNPQLANFERQLNVVLNYTLSAACRDIWVDSQKARTCQILYWYNSSYHRSTFHRRIHRNLVFQFLEVQAYYPPSKDSSVSSGLVFRYAYWSQEDPESRYQIFNAHYVSNVTAF